MARCVPPPKRRCSQPRKVAPSSPREFDVAPAGRQTSAATSTLEHGFGQGHAPIHQISLVADKRTVLIVVLLGDGPKRFNEIKRSVGGISQRVLTFTLRGLERDGLVTRTVFPTTPQRVDYELTKRGSTLWEAVETLGSWARAHVSDILKSREQFDKKVLGSGKNPSSLPFPSRSTRAPIHNRAHRTAPRRSANQANVGGRRSAYTKAHNPRLVTPAHAASIPALKCEPKQRRTWNDETSHDVGRSVATDEAWYYG
jgi:DNA-binding HxlR family transcriptional regulator